MSTPEIEATMSLGPLAVPPATVALPSPTFAERYQLGAVIATGGLATIRTARDVVLDREVAVKQLRDRDPGLTARFLREARLTSRLIHPGIVPVYDLGLDAEGIPSYAMKWVDGRPLSQAITEATTLEARLALVATVVAIAEAVAYAHSQRVIHRDLKPANVIIGAFGEVVVIDWGLALPFDEADLPRTRSSSPRDPRLTSIGSVLGTPCYMPPEQARGDQVDLRADVYALGAILYQLVAGSAPYDQSGAHTANSDDPVWQQVIAGPPRAITAVEPAVPAELAAIIERAMARKVGDRFGSAAELAAALISFLAHQTSQRLAAVAGDRVDELTATLAEIDATSLEAVGAAYRLADVARFGLEQALVAWPANPSAQRGLTRLRAALFDFELERDNLAAATGLAAELPDDTNRQSALARRREIIAARAAAVAATSRDLDQRVGLRQRTTLYAVMLVLMLGMFAQTLAAGVTLGQVPTLVTLQRNSLIVLAVMVGGLVLTRKTIFANAASTAAARTVVAVVAAVLVHRTFAMYRDLDARDVMTVDLFIATAVVVTYGRWWAALPLALGAACASLWPVTTRLVFNAASLGAGLIVLASWRREAKRAAEPKAS